MKIYIVLKHYSNALYDTHLINKLCPIIDKVFQNKQQATHYYHTHKKSKDHCYYELIIKNVIVSNHSEEELTPDGNI